MATFSGPTTAGGMYNYQQNAAAGALAMAGLFGASGAVTVPLNGVTGGRHWNVNVSTVGAGGQNSAVSGLGFAETFPQQLSQRWSPAEWGAFVTTANSIVQRHLGGAYKWRYAMIAAPFLLMIVVMAIIIPTFMSGGSFFVAPMLIVVLFVVILGSQLLFVRAYRAKLDAALADLAAHCQAANQSSQSRGLTWSIKQAQASRRSIAVWLQGDLVPQQQQQVPATGIPYIGQPGLPYGSQAASYGQPSTAPDISLPTYGAAAGPLQWPPGTENTATPGHGAPGASAPQFPKTGAPDLQWPV